jgi:hypothetical protein
MARGRKRYGLGGFLFDFILGCLTGGIWWAYLIFRALRHNS